MPSVFSNVETAFETTGKKVGTFFGRVGTAVERVGRDILSQRVALARTPPPFVTAIKSVVAPTSTKTTASVSAPITTIPTKLSPEQEALRVQVQEVVGKPVTYQQAETLVAQAMKQEGVSTKQGVAGDVWGKLQSIWKTSPLSLSKVWWRETGTPSGARTPTEVKTKLQQTLGKMGEAVTHPFAIKRGSSIWGKAPVEVLMAGGFEEAEAQRIAGKTLQVQQKFVASEYKKISKDFEKKYPTNVVIDTLPKWEQYKKDLLDLKTKEAKLGFYQPDDKTLANPVLEKTNVPMYYKQVQAVKTKYGDADWRVRAYQVGRIMGDVGEAVIIGGITYGTGVAGAVGRGSAYLMAGSKVLPVVVGAGLIAGFGGWEGYRGYTSYRQLGMSGVEGAIEGGISGLGKVGGFMIGASGGRLSPIQYRTIKDAKGNIQAQIISYENPFGKSAYPIVTRTTATGKVSLGYPKKMDWSWLPKTTATAGFEPLSKTEAGFVKHFYSQQTKQLATQGITMDKSLKIMKELYNVQIHDTPTIDFSKSTAFNQLNSQQQKIFQNWIIKQAKTTKGVKGLISAISNKGLERIYGSSTISAEKGFETNLMRQKGTYGDFDINFRDTAKDKAQALYNLLKSQGTNVRWQPNTSLIEVKAGSKWVHLADLHGTDVPELMLTGDVWGYKTQPTKTYMVKGQKIAGQKLGQSLVEKGGSLLEMRQTPKGELYFSPSAERSKDVADFVSIAERLNLEASQGKINQALGISGKTSQNIAQLKNILKVNFPDIKFDTGIYEQVFASVSTPKSRTVPFGAISSVSPSMKTTPASALKSPSFKSISPSVSLSSSMISPSIASLSPSISPSVSPSVSPSRSPSPSPSPSPYPSPSPAPFTTPYIPMIPIPLGWGEPKQKRTAGKKGKKKFVYTPDFTAKALGIKMGKADAKMMKKILEQEFTGLEVRKEVWK